ncbi:efflux transporter outer membrane subunit [Niabella yanshanensis]|uniref:Efflux transporter outer membrane subunit n=1 Tax=Niabella yanshanensis TaxID=577386 RepID=A0ABZ0W165_9BACT|nr:efflux transporter outer membrane subunit [Niabella yanshanensis]WQD36403.1 efflux transporter outer membrane subunit [Niabella yanshanensis]
MKIRNIFATLGMIGACIMYAGCHIPQVAQKQENKEVPETYAVSQDTSNTGLVKWRDFFTDPNLAVLIDTALKNNQELNITLQEIEIARNEVRAKKGELLPSVGYRAGIGIDKAGRYTSQGAGDASTEMTPGKKVPDYLGDFIVGINANWEVDIWNKLHNAKDAEVGRYLSTIEGKNFVLSNLIAEIANSYYELVSLDYQLDIVKQNIALQKNALEIVKVQKQAARATELAVQKFEAEVKSTQSREFEIRQGIKETENRINFLLARYPQPIARKEAGFMDLPLAAVSSGVPSQLLANRPDIRQAELELAASKLDVKVARAQFYPSFDISAMIGFNAFNPSYLVKFPESLITSLVGDLAGPLINKNAIKAQYLTANAKQLQAVYNYERSILSGYIEVANQLSNISNLQQTFDQKQEQVKMLNKSVEVSNALYKAARADYLEVLTTQRDVLEARLELAETKKNQLGAVVNIYKDLGGGWR